MGPFVEIKSNTFLGDNLMMTQLLAQIIYIFFPILLYYSILKNSPQLIKYNSMIMGVLCGIAIFLCMTYPISFVTGNIMDLRTIPWILSFLYGGFHVGTILTVFMFIFRIMMGGMGMYVVLIAYSISFIILVLYFKKYHEFSYQKRVKSTFFLTFVNALLVVTCIQLIFQFSNPNIFSFYFFFIVLHLITIFVAVYIIETFHENERLQQELQRSEKLNVIGQMAASIAHEIRNPMTTVHGFLQLLSQDKATPEKHKEHFNTMIVELNRAETIISDYLTLAKPEAEKLEQLDVTKQLELMKYSLNSFAILHGVNLKISYSKGEQFLVKGSAEKIQQVLVNMIKNAIEVSPKGGDVVISLSKNKKGIQIEVKDFGCGMSQEVIDNIGTPFYSLKEKGTGLGLTVCYSIIKSMGGTIEVESIIDQGTSFLITIPEDV